MTRKLDIVRVLSPLEFAQAALVLGEQRVWVEALTGADLAEYQPCSPREYAQLSEYYAPPGQLVLALIDAIPVGVVAIRPTGPGRAELKRLYVRRPARGLDLGRRLVAEAVEVARERGFTSVFLETSPGMMRTAYALYRSLGFVDTRADDFEGVGDVVGMELVLGEPLRRAS